MKCCKTVVLSCDQVLSIPYGSVVSPGFSRDGCTVLLSHVSPCMVCPSTEVRFSHECSWREEVHVSNISIEISCKNGESGFYVYPKEVYETLEKLYIEPVARGEPAFSPGLILSGPPGSGKSVMARLISRKLGIEPMEILMSRVLSKWLGESEKNIEKIFRKALKNAPSVVIIDDADVIMRARSMAREEHQYIQGMFQVFANMLQHIANTREPVLTIATVNVKTSELDQAFLRAGRFGDPIMIPLPDFEGVYLVARRMLGDEERAREIARKIVNAGLSMADAVKIIEVLKRTGVERIESRGGRGYTRVSIDRVDEFKLFLDPNRTIGNILMKGKNWRIQILGDAEVAAAIGIQISYAIGRSPVLVNDTRYIDEAVHMTNMINGVLIVPLPNIQQSMLDEILKYIFLNTKTSIILTGKNPVEGVYRIRISMLARSPEEVMALVKAVARYKDIKIPEDVEKILMKRAVAEDKIEQLLEEFMATGYIDSRMLSGILTLTR